MISRHLRPALVVAAMLLAALAPAALGQVNLLWYKEVAYDGRIYVFNDPNTYKMWESSHEMGKSITRIGHGPNGETVVCENENALDLYNFKHNIEAEVREYAPPKPPSFPPPTTLKIGDSGEVKFGLLLQGWYVYDDSKASTGASYYGNTIGFSTFRLRRSEIKVSGKITPAWGFEVMFDPAKTQNFTAGNDDKILQDLAISFLGLKGHEFSLGQKKIYVTEEGVRSSSELDFAERARVTRTFSDRRETGFFYKGDVGEHFTVWSSFTNGTPSNVVDDSNDTLFGALRLDFKMPGLLLGVSGGTSGGEGIAHRTRDRYGAHVKWDPTNLPIAFRAEYLRAKDGLGAITSPDLERDGFYATLLFNFTKELQIGARFDRIDNNIDVDKNKIDTWTFGFHYLPKGKNLNIKLDFFKVKQENRRVNNVPDEDFNQFVLAVQAAF